MLFFHPSNLFCFDWALRLPVPVLLVVFLFSLLHYWSCLISGLPLHRGHSRRLDRQIIKGPYRRSLGHLHECWKYRGTTTFSGNNEIPG